MVRSHTLRQPPMVRADASMRAPRQWLSRFRGTVSGRAYGPSVSRRRGRALGCLALSLLIGLGGCAAPQQRAGDVAPREDRLRAYLDLANGYLDLGDLNRAKLPLERALEVDSRSWEANAMLGRVYQREGDLDLAEQYFRRAVRFGPDVPRVRNDYGVFLYQQGRYEEAADQLRQAVGDPNNPQRAVAYENLGLASLEAGARTEARNAFSRAVMLDEKMSTSLLELAELAFADADYSQSAAWYQRFRSLTRQNARSLWLGVRLARLADDADAEASYALQLRNLFPLSKEYRLLQETLGEG